MLKLFPDNLFYDNLGESNSVRIKKPRRSAGDITSDMFDYAIAAAAFNQALVTTIMMITIATATQMVVIVTMMIAIAAPMIK